MKKGIGSILVTFPVEMYQVGREERTKVSKPA